MDRLESMALFVAVVDEGGFAAAARKMKISPPAVTRAISELEASMGVRLLTRTTRVVRVTDVGARYAADCRRVLADIAEIEDQASGAHGAVRGRLVVTASELFGKMYMTPIVLKYLRAYPQAEVECRFNDRVVNMLDEGVDVAVRIGQLQDSSYQAIRVGHVRRVVCASPAYLKQHGTPAVPDDLQHHVIISANGVTPSPNWRFANAEAFTVVRVAPKLTMLSNDAAIIAAVDGFGITCVFSYMVAPHLSDGRLVEVLDQHQTDVLPVHVMHHEGRHDARKVRAFLDLAVQELRGGDAVSK
ncbi:MAG: LysR family transcriptional regulator [Telluria sp.]